VSGRRNAYTVLVGIPDGKKSKGIPRHRWGGKHKN
jgi:hypothetical protein